MQTSRWLAAIDAHRHTIDTDMLVAAFIAQKPDRLWSLTDVLLGLRAERDLSDLQDAVDELVCDGFLAALVYLGCECDTGLMECSDPLCGDMLFGIRPAQ